MQSTQLPPQTLDPTAKSDGKPAKVKRMTSLLQVDVPQPPDYPLFGPLITVRWMSNLLRLADKLQRDEARIARGLAPRHQAEIDRLRRCDLSPNVGQYYIDSHVYLPEEWRYLQTNAPILIDAYLAKHSKPANQQPKEPPSPAASASPATAATSAPIPNEAPSIPQAESPEPLANVQEPDSDNPPSDPPATANPEASAHREPNDATIDAGATESISAPCAPAESEPQPGEALHVGNPKPASKKQRARATKKPAAPELLALGRALYEVLDQAATQVITNRLANQAAQPADIDQPNPPSDQQGATPKAVVPEPTAVVAACGASEANAAKHDTSKQDPKPPAEQFAETPRAAPATPRSPSTNDQLPRGIEADNVENAPPPVAPFPATQSLAPSVLKNPEPLRPTTPPPAVPNTPPVSPGNGTPANTAPRQPAPILLLLLALAALVIAGAKHQTPTPVAPPAHPTTAGPNTSQIATAPNTARPPTTPKRAQRQKPASNQRPANKQQQDHRKSSRAGAASATASIGTAIQSQALPRVRSTGRQTNDPVTTN